MQKAALKMGFSDATAVQLVASLGEFHSNIIEHSKAPESGMLAYSDVHKRMEFVAFDSEAATEDVIKAYGERFPEVARWVSYYPVDYLDANAFSLKKATEFRSREYQKNVPSAEAKASSRSLNTSKVECVSLAGGPDKILPTTDAPRLKP